MTETLRTSGARSVPADVVLCGRTHIALRTSAQYSHARGRPPPPPFLAVPCSVHMAPPGSMNASGTLLRERATVHSSTTQLEDVIAQAQAV